MNTTPTLDEVMRLATENGRVCPHPTKWNQLWEMLPDRRRVGAGWEPSLPLILAAWHNSPHLAKIMRMREHIQWAHDHDCLSEIYALMNSFTEDDWYYGD